MKKIVKILFLAGTISVLGLSKSNAQQIVIRAKLHEPVRVAPPPAPSHHHIWVEGEWVPNGPTYVYKAGYWELPPRPHAHWVRGHWRHFRGGWAWIPGHWR